MKHSTVLFGTVFLLSLKVFGFAQRRYTDLTSYQWNATSFTLRYSEDASDGALCKGCLSNETRQPICQRRLYAQIASCYNPHKGRLLFDLRLRSTGSRQEVSGSQSLRSEDRSKIKLTFQPWKRALVVNFEDLTLIQYSSFTLKWNSTSSTQLFTVDYSVDGIHWNNYTEDERVKVFQVRRDEPTHCMCRKLLTRFLRMKSRNEFSIGTSLEGYYEAAYCTTSNSYRLPDCQEALGMESHAIADAQISASSYRDQNKSRPNSRGWATSSNTGSEWLQIDLLSSYTMVTAVETKGRKNEDHWVTKYYLNYSNDGVTFQYYREPGETTVKHFDGNTNRSSVVRHNLSSPIRARYIRFCPIEFQGVIAMRVELRGCSGKRFFNTTLPSSDSMNHTGLYLGCFRGSGELFYSGLHGYAEIDQKVCIKRCSDLGFSYAAIQSGLQCFCGNNVSSVRLDQPECLLPFISDAFYPNPMRFYRIPREKLSGKYVSFSDKRRRLGEILTVQAITNNHEIGMVWFTVDYGDGNELTFCDLPGTYFYRNPGLYKAVITAEDLRGNRLNFSEYIEIADNLTQLVFKCPKASPQGQTVRCEANVARALKVQGNISVENERLAELPQIPDSRIYGVGEDVPRYLPTTQDTLQKVRRTSAEVTYVLPGHKVQEEGYLASLEFIVAEPGPIRIQVLRQSRDTKVSQKIRPLNVLKCTEPRTFFVDQGDCCLPSSSCDEIDPAAAVANKKYLIISDITLAKHNSTGYHSVDVTRLIQVKLLPGDMFAWLSSSGTGKIAVVGKKSSKQGRAFKGIVDGHANGKQILGPSLRSDPFNTTFALSAHIVPLSLFSVMFHLAKITTHSVLLTLWDGVGNTEVGREEVVLQRQITGLALNLSEFAPFGKIINLELSIANGTNVTYIWNFGKNNTKEVFTETSVTHTFTFTGAHNISVVAYNNVSVAQTECFGLPYVLYAVENLTISFLAPAVANENLTIVVSLSRGSLVDLVVSLGDGSPEFNLSKIDVRDIYVASINHSYSVVGVFTVRALATNVVSNASALLNATVQLPIAGFNVSTPQGVQSSHENLQINVSVTQGTDVQYNISLSGNSSLLEFKRAFGNFTVVVFPKRVLRPGVYSLKVRAYNLVSFNESVTKVAIVTPITNVILRAKPTETGKVVWFQFYYRTGSNVSLRLWKSISKGSIELRPFRANVFWWRTLSGMVYSSPGVYSARANYSNVLGYMAVDTPVVVQEPVRDVEVLTDRFVSLPPGFVVVYVKQNGKLPTNATVICWHGDGSVSDTLDFNTDLNVSHRYNHSGDYRLVVNVSNLVSFVSKELSVTVVKVPTYLIITAKSAADALSSEAFSSQSGDTFPFEFSVLFTVEQDGEPDKNVSFRFDFGDGSTLNATDTEISANHTYASTGEYNVTLTLIHRFDELRNSTKITIKESLTGLTISDDAPAVVNKMTTFTLSWDTLGTGTLIEVYFGDGEQIRFRDNRDNVGSTRGAFRQMNPSQKSISFEHTYKEINVYYVTVKGWNQVSSRKLFHRTVDVEKKCRYPSPVILGVGKNTQVASHFTKDREIIVYTRIVIDCKTSYETAFVWKAYEGTCHDSENNQSTPIIISSDMTKPSLTIPPYSLPHGPICLKFQAKMKYIVDGIDSNAKGYLTVIPGKLKARMLGGNFRIVGSQRTVAINGSISEDSDQKGETLSGVQFLWFCRRINETFPPGVEEMPLAGPLIHSGDGCGGHGPRRLIYSSHSWEISPGVLRIDEKYVIKLVIRNDSREDAFEQIVQVVQGIPPEVAIGCKINCEDKVNKQSALTVSCNCGNCDQEGFVNVSYRWELHVKTESSGIWEPVTNLNEKAITNINRENLVLRKDTLNAGHNYRVTCRVKTEAGTEGRSEQNFITNTPPQNGTCSIYPTKGEALKTFFQIKCPDWHDEDGYITYKLFKRTKLLQHWNEPVLKSTLLPQGKPEENYTYSITVTISDKYGSFSQVLITVKVTEAELTQGELFNMLTSKDGLLTNMLLSGDTQGVAQLVRSFASELAGHKAATKGGTSGGGGRGGKESGDGHSEMKKANIQMKETLLGALETLEPESIDTVGVLIEAMADITKDVEEVSTTSQMSMLRILSTAVSTLSAKKSANSLAAIERVGAGMMESIGNLFGASKYHQDMNAWRLKDQVKGQDVADLNDEGDKLNDNARNMTKAAMKVVDEILDTLSEFLVTGQDQVILESESMSAIAKKLNVEDLATANIFISGGSFVLPSMEDILGSWKNPDCYVLAKGLNTKDNPFIWDNSSTGVNGNCLGLRFEDCHGNPVNVANLSDPINITIPRQGAGNSPEPENFAIEQKTLKSHKITIDDSSYSMHAIVQPRVGNCSLKFQLFLRRDEKPTTQTYDFNWTMDVMPGVHDWKDGFSMFFSNLQLQNLSSDTGVYYLSVYVDFDEESQKESTCAELNYTLSTFMSSCTFWDEEEEKWKGSGCEVTSKTTFDTTVCRCKHLTNFGGGFFVAPNPIDFDAAFKGFTDIASNPIVFATVLTIFGLYFIGVIWARWRDKEDLQKIGVTPLLSNDPRDTHGYEITLQTGFQQKRRTTADVFIQLYGSISDSEPRMLKDRKRAKFGRGEIDQFLFTVPQTLGRIREIHIWHNNAGKSPAWYLFRVLVRDLQTDVKWWFVCDQWLAVEEGDGAVDRRLQVATKAELTKFNILFVNATRKNLLDGHLWLSVFTRPPKSTFTRVHRLSCCLSLVLSTMLANLMFYQVGADDNSTASQSIHIGPFIFSVKQIVIGVQSSFLVLPVNMIIVSIFRKLKPKKDKVNSQSKKYEEVEEEQEPCEISPKTEGEDVTRADEYEKSNSKKTTFSWGTVANVFKKEEGLGDHPKKPKKRFLFPHWCVYIAYMLVAISSLTCGLFCMLHGFTFGKEKSEKWLTSMLVSFFQSIIVIQPFKVLLLAAFFALIIKDPNREEEEEEEDAPDPALNTDEELIGVEVDKDPLSFRLHSKPPDAKKLEAARKLRLMQCEMKAIIKEIVTHFLVVCVVLIVAYGNHDSRAFNMTNEVKNVLVDGDPNKMSFDLITTKEVFFDWASNSFVPTLFPLSAQDEYPYVGITRSKQASNVLGIARIRQLRVKKDTCKVPQYLSNIIPDCIDFYSWSGEERRDFVEGWLDPSQVNETENKKSDRERFASPWHYQTVLEASSFPCMGKISSYRGGGFIVQFGADKVRAMNDLTDLKYWGWSDRYTRALFAELSLYNVNINLLCVVTLLFEDLPTGSGQTHVNIQTIRLYRYIANFSAALIACEVIFAFLLLGWIVRDAKRLWKERKAFWKNIWNIVDIGVTSLSITSLVLYFFRLAFLNKAVHEFRENRSKFVSFQYVVLLNEGVDVMIAFVVLLVSLKFLRMLRFNRKISVLSSTIKASAKKLASFMVMFLVIFLAYCFLVLLVFGPVLEDYRSIIRCMVSMMAMVLGSFEFYDLVEVNRFIGPAVFFSFMVIFQFIIMNMFIGILCDSFNDVRTDAVKQSNEYEILEFMTNRVKAFLGRFVEPPIRPEYNWPKSELEKKVEIIEEKAEATMFFMRNLCAEDTRQTKWFEPGKWTRKKSIVVSLVLNADVEIMENDLWDGIGAINTVVERYSENELDRMLLASRIRGRCLALSQSGVSSMLHDDNFEDSESEDKDTDDDNDNNEVEIKKKLTEDCSAENKYESPNMEKEEDVDKVEEEMEELMEIVEEDFDENDEDEDEQDDAEKYDEEKWEEEIELELGSFKSLASRKSNTPVSLKGTMSISMPGYTQGRGEALGLAANEVETNGSQVDLSCGLASATAPSVQTPASETPSVSTRKVDGLLSVEVPSNRTEPSPIFQVAFGNCTTIFIKEADSDNTLQRSYSDA